MTHFYSAESVTAGHPDKLCDQIADTILDACLANDPNSRVACEVLATKSHIILAGEISTPLIPDIGKMIREALKNAGYDPKDYEVQNFIHPQSPKSRPPSMTRWTQEATPTPSVRATSAW